MVNCSPPPPRVVWPLVSSLHPTQSRASVSCHFEREPEKQPLLGQERAESGEGRPGRPQAMREAGQGWLQGSPVAQNQHRCTVVPKALHPAERRRVWWKARSAHQVCSGCARSRCPGMRRDPAARSNAPTQGLARIRAGGSGLGRPSTGGARAHIARYTFHFQQSPAGRLSSVPVVLDIPLESPGQGRCGLRLSRRPQSGLRVCPMRLHRP